MPRSGVVVLAVGVFLVLLVVVIATAFGDLSSARSDTLGQRRETMESATQLPPRQERHDSMERHERIATSLPTGPHSCRVQVDPCTTFNEYSTQVFSAHYKTGFWGTQNASHTLSGGGSSMRGAFDWIGGLTTFFDEHRELQSIADIPSGDVGWQMAVRHLNTAKAYFGGDIAKDVAEGNAVLFKDHHNKVFRHWDLSTCGIPRWYTTCDPTRRSFDVVHVRDAFQHINIGKVQNIVRDIVLNWNAKYLVTNSYLGGAMFGCTTKTAARRLCQKGNISDGGFYRIKLDCQPFSFPNAVLSIRAHATFPHEKDSMRIYAIDDKLKDAVRRMTNCSSFASMKTISPKPEGRGSSSSSE